MRRSLFLTKTNNINVFIDDIFNNQVFLGIIAADVSFCDTVFAYLNKVCRAANTCKYKCRVYYFVTYELK